MIIKCAHRHLCLIAFRDSFLFPTNWSRLIRYVSHRTCLNFPPLACSQLNWKCWDDYSEKMKRNLFKVCAAPPDRNQFNPLNAANGSKLDCNCCFLESYWIRGAVVIRWWMVMRMKCCWNGNIGRRCKWPIVTAGRRPMRRQTSSLYTAGNRASLTALQVKPWKP